MQHPDEYESIVVRGKRRLVYLRDANEATDVLAMKGATRVAVVTDKQARKIEKKMRN